MSDGAPDGLVVWRDLVISRVAGAVIGVWMLVITAPVIALTPRDWIAYPFAAIGLVLLLGRRRSCTLTQDDLRVLGRFTRRTIRLVGLRQVGRGLAGHIWVQTQDGQVTVLRMVSLARGVGVGPGSMSDIAELIRDRAAARGARLEVARPRPGVPRPLRPRVFGW